MKRPKLTINLVKVIAGVAFSLVWASVMYRIWPQPEYLTFVWFYLGLGSIVLKWIFFEIIDRIYMKVRLNRVRRELEESRKRVEKAGGDRLESGEPVVCNNLTTAGIDEELAQLQKEVLSLGDMVKVALQGAMESLARHDMAQAKTVIEGDATINHELSRIRDYCMQTIATVCPKADDLNTIIAVLGMIVDLERMGDYAKGISRITMMIGQRALEPPAGLTTMMNKGVDMLTDSMAAFAAKDVAKARAIIRMDNEVDVLHDKVFRSLIQSMIEDPKRITQAIWMVWVAHNLERFADRVTNLCEWVMFASGEESPDIGVARS